MALAPWPFWLCHFQGSLFVVPFACPLLHCQLEVEMLRKTLDSCRQEKQEKVEQLLKTDTELQQWREKALVAESQVRKRIQLRFTENIKSSLSCFAADSTESLRKLCLAKQANSRGSGTAATRASGCSGSNTAPQ